MFFFSQSQKWIRPEEKVCPSFIFPIPGFGSIPACVILASVFPSRVCAGYQCFIICFSPVFAKPLPRLQGNAGSCSFSTTGKPQSRKHGYRTLHNIVPCGCLTWHGYHMLCARCKAKCKPRLSFGNKNLNCLLFNADPLIPQGPILWTMKTHGKKVAIKSPQR